MKISERKLLKIAKLLAAVSQNVPNVNYGGCGKFAFALQKKLREYGIRSSAYVLSRRNYAEDVPMARQLTSDYNWVHVILRIGKVYVDATGLYGRSEEDVLATTKKTFMGRYDRLTLIPASQMPSVVKNVNWNPRYDIRYDQIVREILDDVVESNLAPRKSSARASGNN